MDTSLQVCGLFEIFGSFDDQNIYCRHGSMRIREGLSLKSILSHPNYVNTRIFKFHNVHFNIILLSILVSPE
jgi:hypothetical protein